jgi:hypothetical protein
MVYWQRRRRPGYVSPSLRLDEIVPPEIRAIPTFPFNADHTERWCYTCKVFVDISQYRRGYGSCKLCMKVKPEKARSDHLKRAYDLTQEEYDLMLFQQAGVCAICKQPETMPDPYNPGKMRMLAVDHNHETNQVRALLCGARNKMLGYLEKKRTVVDEAIKYLNKYD